MTVFPEFSAFTVILIAEFTFKRQEEAWLTLTNSTLRNNYYEPDVVLGKSNLALLMISDKERKALPYKSGSLFLELSGLF